MLNFYGDIEDVANTLDVFSEADAIANGVEYHYANHLYIHQLQEECALVESLAVTEYNTCGPSKIDDCGVKRKPALYKMCKPEWFEAELKMKEN